MNLTLRQLQIFCSVARSGSTSAAAGHVALSQSATSAAVKELERMLGTHLFDRVGKRLVLNDNGRAVLPAALALLDGAHSLEAGFQRDRRKFAASLQLYASTTVGNYFMPPLLARFSREAPIAHIQLLIGNTLDVVTAVVNFDADLGLIEGPCHSSAITVIPWMQDELVIVAAPAHPLAQVAARSPLTAEQLRGGKWLLRESGSGTRESTDNALLPHLQSLQVAMTLGSPEAIKYAVAEGVGLGCLSRAVVQDLVGARRLSVLATRLPRLTRQLALIHHERKLLSDSLQRFIAFCMTQAAREDS
ncbi:MAG: LysR family transcriptional regulator [Steroidobacteraceae bacterium]